MPVPRVVSNHIGVDLAATYDAISTSTPEIPAFPHKLGTQVMAADGSIWVFGKAGGSIAQYDTVVIDKDHNAIIAAAGGALATNVHHKHGWRHDNAAMTSGQAGWFMLHGAPLIRVGDSCAANAQLYTTATAGVLDDAVSSGSQYPIRGIFLASAAGTATGSVVNGVQAHATFPHTAPATVT